MNIAVNNIELRVRDIIKTCIEPTKPIEEIGIDDNLFILGMDSLNCIKVIISIESEFDFEFDDDDLNFENFKNIRGITSYIERRI